MKKNNIKKVNNKINDILEIPKEISTNEPKITVSGFNQIFIENYKSILEYEDFFIKINTFIGAININGFNLTLKQMTQDDIIINGKIESIDIERFVDEVE